MSSLVIGLISIFVIVAIIVAFIIFNAKMKKESVLTNAIAFLLALIFAIFLCKPLLALFDKMFNFSMVFYNIFMLQFANIDSLNQILTPVQYNNAVNAFKESTVGISDTLKSFLIQVFDQSNAPTNGSTTLGAVASASISYMLALFIVALILFAVSFILFRLLISFIFKKVGIKKGSTLKPLCVVIGVLKGLIVSVIVLITISTLPFLGITNDYFANGFDTTKVLSPVYRFVVNTEQQIYSNALDFTNTNNQIIQKTEGNLDFGTYKNNTEGDKYIINVSISDPYINVKVTLNGSTTELANDDYKYIFSNNTLYLYKDDKLEVVLLYNKNAGTIKFKAKIEEKSVSYLLKKVG